MPTWVIVGASRGMGYQYLKTLSRDPSNTVFGIVRTPEPTKAKVAADNLPNVQIVYGDLTDSASLRAAAEEISAIANGTVDYLIITAAHQIATHATAKDYVGAEKEAGLLSELDLNMRTNAVGPLYTINAFIPLLLKSQIKKVICMSSGGADPDLHTTCGMAGQLSYCMSKAALNVLTAQFAVLYKSEGVKFLALSPGYVLTIAESIDQIPPEVASIFQGFTESFRKINPKLEGPLTTEVAVDMHLKIIENLTIEQSGQFISHLGNKQWF